MVFRRICICVLSGVVLAAVSCRTPEKGMVKKDSYAGAAGRSCKLIPKSGYLDNSLKEFLMRTNNGKGMIAVGQGLWLVLEPSGSKVSESVSLCEVELDKDGRGIFGESALLAGSAGQAFINVDGGIISSAMVSGSDGHLYVGISDESGIFVIKSRSRYPKGVGQLYSNDSWISLGFERSILGPKVLGDLVITADGEVLVAYCRRGVSGEDKDEIGIAVWSDGRWRSLKVADGEGVFPPTAAIDRDGRIHLVWSDGLQQLFYSCAEFVEPGRGLHFVFGPEKLNSLGRSPVITVTGDDKVLIAFESDLSTEVKYALVSDGRVESLRYLTAYDARFHREIWHSPQFCVDSDKVAWLFFVNATRRYVFASRWLGGNWGPIFQVGGIHCRPSRQEYRFLPVGRLNVFKGPLKTDRECIGVHIKAEEPTVGRSFFGIRPFEISVYPDGKILFLDLGEIAVMKGLEVAAHTAVKSEMNPLLEPNNPDSFDSQRVFNHGTVIYEDGRFRLWYAAIGKADSSRRWWHNYRAGYAESNDGLHWEKIDTGYFGGINANRLPDMPPMLGIYKDDEEPDPTRRYKLLHGYYESHMKELFSKGQLEQSDDCYHGRLFTSPDGLKWNRTAIKVGCPGVQSLEVVPQCLFRDKDECDLEKRFKAYGYTSLTQGQRGVAMFYSADSVNWTAYEYNPVLAPELRACPFVPAGPFGHVHDVSVFKCAGYYLGLYQYLYSHTRPVESSLVGDIELAMSRDGLNWTYLNCGNKVIELGDEGAWDKGFLVPSVPVIVGDQIWLYYGGFCLPEGGGHTGRAAMGLAKLRLDGFSSLRLKSGAKEGFVETVALKMGKEPVQLVLNADCSKGEILAEVIDAATGDVIEGYSAEQCLPMKVDSVKYRLQWDKKERIESIEVPVRIRLYIKCQQGSPELFSVSFL
ncbi:MAG: hypothetical protein JXB29_10835 [Sedimentisphaerales bacterium]|nr:hypothetical protein [Sedimentisphaerales bacterium]